MDDLKVFKERAVYRVDWCYGQHVIKGGNNYQRCVNQKNKKPDQQAFDNQATSTFGMIGHLNKKLSEMTAKGRSKQKSNLVALERRFEARINSQTIPTSHLQMVTAGNEPSNHSNNKTHQQQHASRGNRLLTTEVHAQRSSQEGQQHTSPAIKKTQSE